MIDTLNKVKELTEQTSNIIELIENEKWEEVIPLLENRQKLFAIYMSESGQEDQNLDEMLDSLEQLKKVDDQLQSLLRIRRDHLADQLQQFNRVNKAAKAYDAVGKMR